LFGVHQGSDGSVHILSYKLN